MKASATPSEPGGWGNDVVVILDDRLDDGARLLQEGGAADSDERFGAVLRADGGGVPRVMENDMEIRRLTPRECERLQGFPDDWTKIPYRGKPAEECPDGPRYKAMGNSMAVPVMAWIGDRIDRYEHGQLH